MLIQNTNPMNVCPEQRLVRQGFLRDDLFTAVHEQFMTDTAKLADVVLPATMFLEHDDIYKGGGNQHVTLGAKQVEPPVNELGGPQENLYVIDELAKRLGLGDRPEFNMSARQHLDRILNDSGYGSFDDFEERKWIDEQPDFETSNYLNGFAHADGKFRFKPKWRNTRTTANPPEQMGLQGDLDILPQFPDYAASSEVADDAHPFRLATSPARAFLNSTFAQTKSSIKQERGRPELKLHPEDAAKLGVGDGELIMLGNSRGEISVHVTLFEGVRRGVVIQEGLWPNSTFVNGEGINTLVGADTIAPNGGVGFHDTKVWIRAV
jgi:anaerobic selenocysteine-containing dehydrogenase